MDTILYDAVRYWKQCRIDISQKDFSGVSALDLMRKAEMGLYEALKQYEASATKDTELTKEEEELKLLAKLKLKYEGK